MKISQQTVWTQDDGTTLLIRKGVNEYYTPLASMDLNTIISLSSALVDAIDSAADFSQNQNPEPSRPNAR